jgi:hypothetical protein
MMDANGVKKYGAQDLPPTAGPSILFDRLMNGSH